MKKILAFILLTPHLLLAKPSENLNKNTSLDAEKVNLSSSKKEKEVFYLSPESPLNKESLDLNQALFIGETSLSFNIRNPLDGTSGGNACSSCSH